MLAFCGFGAWALHKKWIRLDREFINADAAHQLQLKTQEDAHAREVKLLVAAVEERDSRLTRLNATADRYVDMLIKHAAVSERAVEAARVATDKLPSATGG